MALDIANLDKIVVMVESRVVGTGDVDGPVWVIPLGGGAPVPIPGWKPDGPCSAATGILKLTEGLEDRELATKITDLACQAIRKAAVNALKGERARAA